MSIGLLMFMEISASLRSVSIYFNHVNFGRLLDLVVAVKGSASACFAGVLLSSLVRWPSHCILLFLRFYSMVLY